MTIIEQLYAIVKTLPQEQASEILTFAEFIRAQHLNAQESIAILDTSTSWFEVIVAAYRLRLGEEIGSENLYGWLKVFDKDELSELIAEIEKDYRLVESEPAAWDRIEATIYEWHESAIALSSPELAAAFSDEIDEVLLPIARASETGFLQTISWGGVNCRRNPVSWMVDRTQAIFSVVSTPRSNKFGLMPWLLSRLRNCSKSRKKEAKAALLSAHLKRIIVSQELAV